MVASGACLLAHDGHRLAARVHRGASGHAPRRAPCHSGAGLRLRLRFRLRESGRRREPGPSRLAAALRDSAASVAQSPSKPSPRPRCPQGEQRPQRRYRPPNSRLQGCRGPACPLFRGVLTCGRGVWGYRAPQEPHTFLAPGSQPSPNPAHVDSAEPADVRNLGGPKPPQSGPVCSAWAVTWASRDPRRGPRRKGAQMCPGGLSTAGRFSPFTRSTGSSTSTAHTRPRGSDPGEGGSPGRPPGAPCGWSVRPGGAFP